MAAAAATSNDPRRGAADPHRGRPRGAKGFPDEIGSLNAGGTWCGRLRREGRHDQSQTMGQTGAVGRPAGFLQRRNVDGYHSQDTSPTPVVSGTSPSRPSTSRWPSMRKKNIKHGILWRELTSGAFGPQPACTVPPRKTAPVGTPATADAAPRPPRAPAPRRSHSTHPPVQLLPRPQPKRPPLAPPPAAAPRLPRAESPPSTPRLRMQRPLLPTAQPPLRRGRRPRTHTHTHEKRKKKRAVRSLGGIGGNRLDGEGAAAGRGCWPGAPTRPYRPQPRT